VDEARTGKRFPVALPIRLDGDDATAEPVGSTHDMSAAGVYLVLDRTMDPGSIITFVMTIPADAIGAPQDMTVRCTGRVIRSDPKGPRQNGVACVIDSYEFVRPGEKPEAEVKC
jgi:PilZ domain